MYDIYNLQKVCQSIEVEATQLLLTFFPQSIFYLMSNQSRYNQIIESSTMPYCLDKQF